MLVHYVICLLSWSVCITIFFFVGLQSAFLCQRWTKEKKPQLGFCIMHTVIQFLKHNNISLVKCCFLLSDVVCSIPGQLYQVCGSSCQQTCREISMDFPCKEECVEGCNCPVGMALRDDNQCVPFSRCPCYRDGRAYDPGTLIKPTNCTEWWAALAFILKEIRKYSTRGSISTLKFIATHKKHKSCQK